MPLTAARSQRFAPMLCLMAIVFATPVEITATWSSGSSSGNTTRTLSPMLVVTMELWPYGESKHSRVLGLMAIANVAGDIDIADYLVARQDEVGVSPSVVTAHRRAVGFWPLLARAALGTEATVDGTFDDSAKKMVERITRGRLHAIPTTRGT